MKLKICKHEYTVVFGDPSDVGPLAGREGLTHPGSCTIYVANNLPPDRLRDVLLHEIMHALLESSGVGSLLEAAVQESWKADIEESLIRLLVPHVLALVDDNGKHLLRCPAPKGKAAGPGKGKKRGRSR